MKIAKLLPQTLSVLLVTALAGSARGGLLTPAGQTMGSSGPEAQSASSYLGVDTRDVTEDRLAALRLKEEHGVEITMVDQDAPAGKAGLREHDVILNLNGTAVESVEQLRRMIHEIPPGRIISMSISRDGQALTLKAQLSSRQNSFTSTLEPKDFHFEMPALPNLQDFDLPVSVVVVHSSLRSGLLLENLTPQLGEFFGAKSGEGVLVRSVEKGSQADKAGFKAGDVVVRVDGQEISDASDFGQALRARQNNKATISILRDRKEQTLTLTLPEAKQSGRTIDQSFEVPDMAGKASILLESLDSEMARLGPGPEMEDATRELSSRLAQLESNRAVAVTPLCDRTKQLRQELLDMQRELRRSGQDQLRKLRLHFDQNRADI